MGQALCTCAGRADDEPHGLYRYSIQKAGKPRLLVFKDGGHDSSLLQTQSRTETRELLSDEDRRNSVRVVHAGGGAYHLHHSNGVFGYALDDHGDATESDELDYYSRQQQGAGAPFLALPTRRRPPPAMNPVTADAFKSKLREPIMSPRSKMQLLVGEGTAPSDDEQDSVEEQDEEQKALHSDNAVKSETSSDRDLRRLRSESAVADVDPAADDDDDEEAEEEYFEFIRIIVPPGPCGVVFQTPSEPSKPPTVEGFVRMYDGSKGPIENCGLVHRGSTLCAINDLDVTTMPLADVIRALNLSSHLEREFVFRK